jgi:hypothetical protein
LFLRCRIVIAARPARRSFAETPPLAYAELNFVFQELLSDGIKRSAAQSLHNMQAVKNINERSRRKWPNKV